MDKQNDERLYEVKEAAKKLKLSPGLLYALCAAKRIRHERHGLGRGKILISADALDEYRQGRTVSVTVPATATTTVTPRLRHLKL